MIWQSSARIILLASGSFLAFTVASCMEMGKATSPAGNQTGLEKVVNQKGTQTNQDPKRLRSYKEKVLPNGLRVFYVEDLSLPYVSFNMLIKSGSAEDPVQFPGLTNFVVSLLDQGTVSKTAPQIADAFTLMGSGFGAEVATDSSFLFASSLNNQTDKLLSLFSEIILQPSFPDVEIERARSQITAGLINRVDDPGAFIKDQWNAYLFGQTNPYGHADDGNVQSIAQIKKKNLIVQYKHLFRPNNAELAVVGKYGPDLEAQVEKVFGGWQSQEMQPTSFPEPTPIKGLQIRFSGKAGLEQSQVRIGFLGIPRKDPDYQALTVANMVLGDHRAFLNRLMDNIRVKQGLTYSIVSQIGSMMNSGEFTIATFTKPETTGKIVSETLNVLREFIATGVTAEELGKAKDFLKGNFPATIETAEKFANKMLLLRQYGLDETELTQYSRMIDRVSLSDVQRAIKKHFSSTNIKVLVYGPPAVLEQLRPLGSVEIEVNPQGKTAER